MCQDSGANQRRPSALDRRRSEIAESSSITAAASGIPAKRRIPESLGPTAQAFRKGSTNWRAFQEKAPGFSECVLSPQRWKTNLLDPLQESRSYGRIAAATRFRNDC